MKRGFIAFCFIGLCVSFLPCVVVAHTVGEDYKHWHFFYASSVRTEWGSSGATCLAAAVAAYPVSYYVPNPLFTGGSCSASSGIYGLIGQPKQQADCRWSRPDGTTYVENGIELVCQADGGSSCAPGQTYVAGAPWYGCAGTATAPPATPDGPCLTGGAPPGDNSAKVDPANCSIYAYKGRVPSSCRSTPDGPWSECPCVDGSCNNYYCPTGQQKSDCVPAGYMPDAPSSPYIPDPNQTKPDSGCTAASGCGGGTPSTAPPPGSGTPDPATGGNKGDVPQGSESTSTTGADGTTTTTQKTTVFNPYSGQTVVKETTTTVHPDGSRSVDVRTTTSGGTAGGGTSTTSTHSKTTTGADGAVTVETDGSSSTTDKPKDDAPKNLASGGSDCSAEPSCTGDAIQCGILKQIWRDDCVFSKISGGSSCDAPPVCDQSQVACVAFLQGWHDRCPDGAPSASQINATADSAIPAGEMTIGALNARVAADSSYHPDTEVDVSTLDVGPHTPTPTGSCPLPFSIVVMGIDVAIGSVELCAFTDWISWLVRISASMFALFIITGYGVSRSSGGG